MSAGSDDPGNRPVAVVTGAGSGIGTAFAVHLAGQGYDLLLVDKDGGALSAVRATLPRGDGRTVDCREVDLRDRDQTRALAEHLATLDRIEVLVNNAGFSDKAPFQDLPEEVFLDLIEVHCVAAMRFTRAAVKVMIERGRGAVINVVALGAFFPTKVGVGYGSTKSFLLHFSQSLHRTLRGRGVYVQALCPGYTHTNIHTDEELAAIPSFLFIDPERVVRESWRALQRRREVCIPSRRHRFLYLFGLMTKGDAPMRVMRRLDRLLVRARSWSASPALGGSR